MTVTRAMMVLAGIVLVLVVTIVVVTHYLTTVPGQPHRGPLPALENTEAATAARLAAHIRAIASRPHNVAHYDELEKAARYIESELTAAGYQPAPQIYQVGGRAVRNIEATIEPRNAAASRGTIVLGAHYDSYGDAPGANDNGTGTAAVLELARLLADLRSQSDVRIRLVLFVNEEPPYFKTADMGSYRYARLLAERREPIIGMVSLETLGCFTDEPGTQHYPPPFGMLYPSTGDFIAFVGMIGSRDLLHALIRSFRSHTAFPTVGGVAPGFVPGIDWSDHWSFEKFHYPAVMVTDTALFRYRHYHQPSDTPDKVDHERLARITHGIERVVREMVRPDWPTRAAMPRT
jgi:Zn-dependent M28 family amino/carboxypeptidase